MNTYKIYKALKLRLVDIAPGFMYLGQYLKSADNTSYRVPALYIEMPKNLNLQYFGKTQVAMGAVVKVHYISHAPFKQADTGVQDSALAAHQAKLNDIEKLLFGFVAKDESNKPITQQLIPTGNNNINFDSLHVFSVQSFTTEFISRHLL